VYISLFDVVAIQPHVRHWIEGLRGVLVETRIARRLAIRVPTEPGQRNMTGLSRSGRWRNVSPPVSVHVRHGDVQK
jgi:hypothetical protein